MEIPTGESLIRFAKFAFGFFATSFNCFLFGLMVGSLSFVLFIGYSLWRVEMGLVDADIIFHFSVYILSAVIFLSGFFIGSVIAALIFIGLRVGHANEAQE